MTVSITVLPRQVKALKNEFGEELTVEQLVQGFVNDWLVQYERNYDERERRQLKVAMESATPETQAQVLALLGIVI